MNDILYKRLVRAELCLFFCVCLIAAILLPIENAPDEAMRYPIAQFIFTHGTLPNGMEKELIHGIWGFSYALYPYLTSILSALCMKIMSIFCHTEAALLIAARIPGILAGTGTVFMCQKIGQSLFSRKQYALLLTSLVGFLPQFVFLCSYQNNDSFAVFTGSLIIYFWIRGVRTDWDKKTILGMGISCGLCMLSYYNAYVYLLCSLLLYFVHRIRSKDSASAILGGAAAILLLAFAIAGWLFLRNALLHNGDFLGLQTTSVSAELYAIDGYKPSQIATPSSLGLSFTDTFFGITPLHDERWIFRFVCSFIGAFAYMNVHLPIPLYALYVLLFFLGLLGLITGLRHRKRISAQLNSYLLLLFPFLILVNLLLIFYNAYYSDYQAQGRYLMPSLIPIMILITEGFRSVFSRAAEKRARKLRKEPLSPEESGEILQYKYTWILLTVYLIFFLISYAGFMLPGCSVIP